MVYRQPFAAINRHFELFSFGNNPLNDQMSRRSIQEQNGGRSRSMLMRTSSVGLFLLSGFLNIMVNTGFLKKAAVCGAAVSVIGAAFFHHRIQGEQKVRQSYQHA